MAAIPLGLKFRDVIGVAETGSGKTAAFVIPMLTYIMKQPPMTEENEPDGPYSVVSNIQVDFTKEGSASGEGDSVLAWLASRHAEVLFQHARKGLFQMLLLAIKQLLSSRHGIEHRSGECAEASGLYVVGSPRR